MPEISLTEFVDFVIKSGTPKLTAVRHIKAMHADEYHPMRDYWKTLRDGIVEMHEQGQPKSALDDVVRRVTAANKRQNYPVLAQAYKKWLGRKSAEWFAPPRADWQHSALTVRVNPELGLTLDGKPHLVKLYFKDQKLTKERIALISKMMLDTVGPKADGACVALLDVRNAKLHAFDTADAALLPLLEGEALSFCRMYEGA
jgi:hypothetical protein